MCEYNDCGWCYAKDGVENNSVNGGCYKPKECPQNKKDNDNVIMSTTDF